MNITDFQDIRRVKVCVLLLVLSLAALPINGAIADTADKGGYANGQEGQVLNTMPLTTASIEKKTLEAVITTICERFKLSKETVITDLNGKQVSIRQMLVPCDAEITFETQNGVRVAQRIKMLRLGRDSRWQWDADRPE
jgi:hypothetical protein